MGEIWTVEGSNNEVKDVIATVELKSHEKIRGGVPILC